MLDTNICSFIMRERAEAVLALMEQAVTAQHRIVVSAITYSELRFGAANPKASPKVDLMVSAFLQRLVTNNTREFSRMPSLVLEDWTTSSRSP